MNMLGRYPIKPQPDGPIEMLLLRLEWRRSLRALNLTDEQMQRFQDRARGIERRLADVLARKQKKGART